MSAHTPGPWIVESDKTMTMVVAEEGGMPGILVSQGPPTKQDKINARLIAAAPDLLDVAERALKKIPSLPCCSEITEGDCYCPNGMLRRDLRNAIAKAKGEA